MNEVRREPLSEIEQRAITGYRMSNPGSCEKQRAAACVDVLALAARVQAVERENKTFREVMDMRSDVRPLFLAQYDRANALQAQLADLTRERDECNHTIGLLTGASTPQENTIVELRQQLADMTRERDEANLEIERVQRARQNEIVEFMRVGTELERQVERLRDDMQHIAEYWNGNENERAMSDACHHVVEVAQQSLRETGA